MSPDVLLDAASTGQEIAAIELKVRRLFLLAFAGLLLSTLVVGLYAYRFHGPLDHDPAGWAQFGDYVGGVLNPIFGFLALIALLWTIALQSKELRLSSQELRNSANALRSQNETLRLQNFESTFFQLLRLHNDIVSAMDIVGRTQTTKGRDCIRIFVHRLRDQLNANNGLADLGPMRRAYDVFYENNQHEIGHYFRLLYNIVKFVHLSDVPNKRFYTNLVRAQLSSDELTLIFFNGLAKWGELKFKALIEEYGLLKTLPEGEFPSAALRAAYKPGAFQGATESARRAV